MKPTLAADQELGPLFFCLSQWNWSNNADTITETRYNSYK